MKLCIHCAWYGGVAAATGNAICNELRNKHVHPVDGLEQKYGARELRFDERYCGMEAKWWKAKATQP